MAILVTGGLGFIGSHTVNALLEANEQVCIFDNMSHCSNNSKHILALPTENISIIEGDIRNQAQLLKVMKKITGVVHLAAQISVQDSISNPAHTFDVNELGFINVLEAIRLTNPNIRLVYASSAAVYGNNPNAPYAESSITHPISMYGFSKLANENHANLYNELYSMNCFGMRYFNVYGKGQNPDSEYAGVITKFISKYKCKEPYVVYGTGQQTRDFIHVKDIAIANLLALKNQETGIANIGTGTRVSLLELLKIIDGENFNLEKINFKDGMQGDIKHSYPNVSHALKCLKFSASIKADEGIQQLMAD